MPRIPTPNFHHARLSLAQAAIREHVARRTPGAPSSGLFAGHPIMQAASAVLQRVYQGEIQDGPTALSAYDARRTSQTAQGAAVASPLGTPVDCLDLMARYAIAWALHDQDSMNQISSEWKDTPCNLTGWLSALVDWLEYYWTGRPPQYNPPTAEGPGVFPIPNATPGASLRVGVLGDWGTGEPEAVAVLDQLMAQSPDLIIHVGDVYYAGTEDEQTNNFLTLIRNARAAWGLNIPVYTLPGNHDYYSGGGPFYQMIPQLNAGVPDAPVQQNSFWCLRNDSWQLQGMDTGYYDSDIWDVGQDTTKLQDVEATWHQQQLQGAGDRQVILFSHHQLFSAFEPIGGAWQNPSLTQNLQTWLGTGSQPAFNLAAWFWGHEHVLEVYQVPGSLPVLGRCIGNGAFPVFTSASDYTPKAGGAALEPATSSPDGGITFPNGFVQTQPDDLVWSSGYMMLELGDGTGTASYYQVTFSGDVTTATSQMVWQEGIPGGGVTG